MSAMIQIIYAMIRFMFFQVTRPDLKIRALMFTSAVQRLVRSCDGENRWIDADLVFDTELYDDCRENFMDSAHADQ